MAPGLSRAGSCRNRSPSTASSVTAGRSPGRGAGTVSATTAVTVAIESRSASAIGRAARSMNASRPADWRPSTAWNQPVAST